MRCQLKSIEHYWHVDILESASAASLKELILAWSRRAATMRTSHGERKGLQAMRLPRIIQKFSAEQGPTEICVIVNEAHR